MNKAVIKKNRIIYFLGVVGVLIGLAVLVIGFPESGRTQEEVSSSIRRYRERVRTGYYEGYEVSPLNRQRDTLSASGILHSTVLLSPTAAGVRIRSYLPDAHAGLKFYEKRTCTECHTQQARSVHADRGGINCRQCHGPEPIPAIKHYYSPMNPIRRHAYVCATCHEGANDLFATYIIHEPAPGALTTKESFPAFFYANWFMVLLLVGTMAFFVPHSLMMILQEIAMKKGEDGIGGLADFIPDRFKVVLQELFPKKERPEE